MTRSRATSRHGTLNGQVEKMSRRSSTTTPANFVSGEENRDRAISLAVSSIEQQFGKGAIMRLGEGESLQADVPCVPSGAASIDIALGIGGYPRGRIIEIYGPESSGKTTLTLHAVAEAQRLGGVAAFVDAEHALDINYAKKLGVKTDELLISQPDTGEQALEIADMLVRSGALDVLVIDSVAALVPAIGVEARARLGDGLTQAARHESQVP